MHPLRLAAISLILATAAPCVARLNENETQSQARYGAPESGLVAAHEEPLLNGAKEVVYRHEGWRIRAAYLGGKTVRIEYAKLPDGGGLKKLTPEEVTSILEAEKGAYRWREEKPRTGYAGLDALKTAFEGRKWERSDNAVANLKLDLVLTLETREVAAYEKRQSKQATKNPQAPQPNVPKF